MKQLNALTFVHEDLHRYSAEAADGLDELETLITDTHSIDTYSEESGLTLSETEAMHLVALTKAPSDFLRQATEEVDYSLRYSDQIKSMITNITASIDNVVGIVTQLTEMSRSTNEADLKAAIMALDLSTLPEGVEVDLGFKTVSELHRFHFSVLGNFITESVAAAKTDGEYAYCDKWETVSLLGLYSISTEYFNGTQGCFITEMNATASTDNTSNQDSTKALLLDIIAKPLPVPEGDLINLLKIIRDSVTGLSDMLDDPKALETEISGLASFGMRVLSVIRGWGFIYGTVYNTAVQIS